jgi:hypothetical protein
MILFMMSDIAPQTPIRRSCRICASLIWTLELEALSMLGPSSLLSDAFREGGSGLSATGAWEDIERSLLYASCCIFDIFGGFCLIFFFHGTILKATTEIILNSGMSFITPLEFARWQ